MPDAQERRAFLQTAWYESKRAAVYPELVLGIIESISGFKQFYTSAADARGLMGVNAMWPTTIGDGDTKKLFDTQTNLRFGCTLLRHFIDKAKGDVFLALVQYSKQNLERGPTMSSAKFPDTVFENAKHWDLIGTSAAKAARDASSETAANRGDNRGARKTDSRSGLNKQQVDTLHAVVKDCVRSVHEAAPSDYEVTYWRGFDAFYNPGSGRVENNAILVGQAPAKFAFYKCMAENGIPLRP